jgi:hypothetical protein
LQIRKADPEMAVAAASSLLPLLADARLRGTDEPLTKEMMMRLLDPQLVT